MGWMGVRTVVAVDGNEEGYGEYVSYEGYWGGWECWVGCE